MKMRSLKVTLLLACVIIVAITAGCSKSEYNPTPIRFPHFEPAPIETNSYIVSYAWPASGVAYLLKFLGYDKEKNAIVEFEDEESGYCIDVQFWSEYNHKERADAIARFRNELGDTLFYGFPYRSELLGTHLTYAASVAGVLHGFKVTCDKDLDEHHPAGSDLADLFYLVYGDNKWIVQNGYKNYEGEDAVDASYLVYYNSLEVVEGYPQAIRCAKLSSVNMEELEYISSRLFLFPENPKLFNESGCTVTLSFEGKSITPKL